MIDVAISTAISFAVLATATLPAILNRRRTVGDAHRESSPNFPRNIELVDSDSVDRLVEEGYAYSIDLGDSRMVVVVLSPTKRGGEPIDVHVLDAQPHEFAEATA